MGKVYLDPNTGEPLAEAPATSKGKVYLDPNTGEPIASKTLASTPETTPSFNPEIPGPVVNTPGWLLDAIKNAGKGALLTGYNVVTGGGKILRKLTPYPDLTPEQQAEQQKVRGALAASEDATGPGHVAHAVGGMAPYFIPGVGPVGGAAAMGAEAYGATDSPVDAALAAGTALALGKLGPKIMSSLQGRATNYVNRAVLRGDAAAAEKMAQQVAADAYATTRGAGPEAAERAKALADAFAQGSKEYADKAAAAGVDLSGDPLKRLVMQQLTSRAIGAGVGALGGGSYGGWKGAAGGAVAGAIAPAAAQSLIAKYPDAASKLIRLADGRVVSLAMIAASRVPAELASTRDEPLRRPSSLHGGSTF